MIKCQEQSSTTTPDLVQFSTMGRLLQCCAACGSREDADLTCSNCRSVSWSQRAVELGQAFMVSWLLECEKERVAQM